MPKPDRNQVTKATRVALVLDIVVPEGMEDRGEDEVFAMLREADDGELRGAFVYTDDDPEHISEYIWEDWERTQREGEA